MKMKFAQRFVGLAIAAVAISGAGCSDGPTEPGGLNFPTLSDAMRSEYCFRGNTTVGETKTGNITASDCEEGDAYFETYVVKVGSTTNARFTITAPFDAVLVLIEITDIDDDFIEYEEIEFVDEEFEGDGEELFATLQPGKNYAIVVSGWSFDDVGSYTLRIQ